MDLNNVTFSLRCEDTPAPIATTRLVNALSSEVHFTELNLTITESHAEKNCQWDIALDNDVDYNGKLSEFVGWTRVASILSLFKYNVLL